MKISLMPLLLVFGFLVILGFQRKAPKSQQELMKEYIDGALEDRRTQEWKDCRLNIILDAERYVDSIIYQQVNFNIGDSLRAPGKPIKPNKPFDSLTLDSTPIVPILKSNNVQGEL